MINELRIGIIGCSNIAKSSILSAINQSQNSKLVFIGSRSLEKAKTFALDYNCEYFGNYDDVLESKNVDAVYISLPVGLHEEWTVKAAESGKHILCEKSISHSLDSARNMVNVCKTNNVRLMEGLMFRFHPQINYVLKQINEKVLENIYSFTGFYGFPNISKNDIRFKKELGGGILNDAGCYPICASRILFDEEPLSVLCKMNIDNSSNVDVQSSLFLEFPNSKIAHISIGYDLSYLGTYEIWAQNASIKLWRAYNIPPDHKAKISITKNMETTNIEIPPSNHFLTMIESFSSEILNIEKTNFNWENDIINQAKVMQAARISNNEGRFVKIEEV
jgi:predicted dehydrogenase